MSTRAARRTRSRHARRPDPLANQPARLFRALDCQWQRDAAGHQVDVLAAELAAHAARSAGSICLGLVRKEAVPRFYGLVFLLDSYGLVLRQRYRPDGTVFMFLDRKADAPSEFAGTVVRARSGRQPPRQRPRQRARQRPALPRAA